MEKRISSFQIILLAVFGAIGVAAVLIFALAVGGSSSSSTGKVVIWGVFDQNTMTTLLRKEADADNRFSQVTYVQKDPTTYEADLADALASGSGPDIFIMQDDEALADSGKTYEIPYTSLSQSQFKNTFVDAADTYLGTNGVLGVPILIDPLVLYWNRDELASAGVAQPPQYWDEVPAIASAITQKSDQGSIQKSAIALGTYTNIDAAKDILGLLIMQAGGAVTAQDAAGHFGAALALGGSASGASQSALRFYTEFADPTQPDYTWSQALSDARQAFGSGELAMYIGYASEEPLIRATNPNLNFAAAPIPQVRSSKTNLDEGRVYALSIPKNSQNPQGALTIAFLLGSSVGIGTDFSTAFGIPSARRDVIATPVQGDQALFDKMALITRTWVDPDPTQTSSIFQAMIEGTESGASSVSDAIQRANQQIGQLFSQPQ